MRPAPHTQYSLGGRAGPNLTEVLGRVERSEVVERDEDRGQRTEDTVEGEFVDEWRKRPWRRFCGNSLSVRNTSKNRDRTGEPVSKRECGGLPWPGGAEGGRSRPLSSSP